MESATNFDGKNRKSLIPYKKKSVLIEIVRINTLLHFKITLFKLHLAKIRKGSIEKKKEKLIIENTGRKAGRWLIAQETDNSLENIPLKEYNGII